MTLTRSKEYLISLVKELIKLPKETEWIEFKVNNKNPEEVGEYISALANSAALLGKLFGYIIWGVSDTDHEVIGTNFKPSQSKKSKEELESWLLRLLNPKLFFRFHELDFSCPDGSKKPVVLLEIHQAAHTPAQFQGFEYIRVGSYKKKLKEFPEKERELWRIFDQEPFERKLASENLKEEDVLKQLDYPAFFDLSRTSLPENRKSIINVLCDENMILKNDAGLWGITNLGAILFAKKLQNFQHLGRKAVRLVLYKGNSRVKTVRELEDKKGYASGFEGLIDSIKTLAPENEVMGKALRKSAPMYPELAIRELVANAIIHQDFSITGTSPMIEIFSDRIEITNPGLPLVDKDRFLDSPPRSRNEILASFLRRIGICEERGSGIDKVVFETEYFQLPAPRFEVTKEHTRAVLFAHKPLKKMDKEDKIRACYLHCCLKLVNREHMNNSSLRARFGIDDQNKAQISRIIKQTIESKFIRPYDPHAGVRNMRYIPWWA